MSTRHGVGPQDHVGIEQSKQRSEVPFACGGEERGDHLALEWLTEHSGRQGPTAPVRRARLASWRAATGVRPTIGAISSNETANMSCNTKASRSAGARVSSTTNRARPTESASKTSSSGEVAVTGSGAASGGDLRLCGPSSQHVQADPGHDGGQPAAEVLDGFRVGTTEPKPRLLNGVIGFVARPEHSERDCPKVLAVGFKALGK